VVILASLAGFDGSPESMRELQLEYGAEIARAVTRFCGPLVFCIVSRNHGGAFVVFSKQLNESIESLAVRGAEASVIGGSAAAAVVFAREVERRAMADPRVMRARRGWAQGDIQDAVLDAPELARVVAEARADARSELAKEFDATHTVERAFRVGSVDRIIQPDQLRPELIHAVRRGLTRFPPLRHRSHLADGKAELA
jgi:acetyl-CoA carboxylase carboxyltransferase component